MNYMLRVFNQFMSDEYGANAIEYALIASLISIVLIRSGTDLGGSLDTIFDNVGALLG